MAIFFMDSMGDQYAVGADVTQIQRKFGFSNHGSGTTPGHRVGGLAHQGINGILTTKTLSSPLNTWILQWHQKFLGRLDGSAATQISGMLFRKTGSAQISLYNKPVSASGVGGQDGNLYNIEIRLGGPSDTLLDTAGPFWADQWYAFQIKVTIATGTGGSYTLQVSKGGTEAWTTVASDTGIGTANLGSDGADALRIDFDVNNNAVVYDNVVIADDTGSLNNDLFAKPVFVNFQVVDGDGADTDWDLQGGASDTADALDDPAAPVDQAAEDATRIVSDTTNDESLVSVSDITNIGSGASILGVAINVEAAMEASGTANFQIGYRNGADARDYSTDILLNSTMFDLHTRILEEEPIAAAAWTISQLNAAQYGVKRTT